jgi:TetR/AcrR family transcriptional regulator, regulator of mycofactocin system
MTETLAVELRARRSQLMTTELEAVALELFAERGFDEVTVEEIASTARISVRTFYRYFTAKEAVFQVQLDRRCEALRVALAARPDDEAPLRSMRLALDAVVSAEDPDLLRRWISVISTTPHLVQSVLGGIQLKTQPLMAAFFAERLGTEPDSYEPIVLAAAVGGVIQAAQTRWFLQAGDIVALIDEGLEVLERGIGTAPPPSR